MATAYECDRCKITFIGEARSMSDLPILGTAFTLRFSFGMQRPKEELESLREQARKLEDNPLAALFGGKDLIDEDKVENVAADLCAPCRAALLREAVELAGLELHTVEYMPKRDE